MTTAAMNTGSRAPSLSLMSMNAGVLPVTIRVELGAGGRRREHVVAQRVHELLPSPEPRARWSGRPSAPPCLRTGLTKGSVTNSTPGGPADRLVQGREIGSPERAIRGRIDGDGQRCVEPLSEPVDEHVVRLAVRGVGAGDAFVGDPGSHGRAPAKRRSKRRDTRLALAKRHGERPMWAAQRPAIVSCGLTRRVFRCERDARSSIDRCGRRPARGTRGAT